MGSSRPGSRVSHSPSPSQIWSLGPTSTAPKGLKLCSGLGQGPPPAHSPPQKGEKSPAKKSYHYLIPTFPQNGHARGHRAAASEGRAGVGQGRAGSRRYLDFQSEVFPAGEELAQRVLGVFHVAAVLPVDQQPAQEHADMQTHTCAHAGSGGRCHEPPHVRAVSGPRPTAPRALTRVPVPFFPCGFLPLPKSPLGSEGGCQSVREEGHPTLPKPKEAPFCGSVPGLGVQYLPSRPSKGQSH